MTEAILDLTKNLRNMDPSALAELILDTMREQADLEGRVVCGSNLGEFLRKHLPERGYYYGSPESMRYFDTYAYSSAVALLRAKRLIVRIGAGRGRSPSVYRVDMVTSLENAKALQKQLNVFLCCDLKATTNPSDNLPTTVVQAENAALGVTLSQKDDIIKAQTKEIERLQALVKDTLQDADKFVKEARKRLKQA